MSGKQSGASPAPPIEVIGSTITSPYSSQTWPIAAAMLQYSPFTYAGEPVATASESEWRTLLSPVADEGFSAIELSNRWLDLASLSPDRIARLGGVCEELGLTTPGYLLASRSILDRGRGKENVRYAHQSIDAAADLGISTVCMGLHSVKSRNPGGPLWFWTTAGSTYAVDPTDRAFVIESFRSFGQHARDRGIQISLEMYPDTEVGSSTGAVAFVRDVAEDNVGINPDLGNLIRVQGPIEEWEDVAVATLPLTNYWHVKNYSRAENPATGAVFTVPTSLELGMINYRKALRFAVGSGFAGTIVAEHYGGDGLGVSATNARYLRRLLASILEETPREAP